MNQTWVMQTANLDAEPRINREAEKFPALASIIARQRLESAPELPPYVVLNMKSRSHVAWGGYLGHAYDPFLGKDVGSLFSLPKGLTTERLYSRSQLTSDLDRMRRDLDLSGSMEATNRFTQQAVSMVTGASARQAFDVSQEPESIRQKYGDHEWCQQALLARRLVESGVSFVTIDLSNHGASGTWDTHGDNIPPYGGIWNGLRPLLPVFDKLITTLVADLGERGLLDDVLVLAMGRVWTDPQDRHTRKFRRPRPLADCLVDDRRWRRVPSRSSDRRHRAGRRSDQGTPRHARRPCRDHLPPHGRPSRHFLPRQSRSTTFCDRSRKADR